MVSEYDILIVGGGMVGAALACGLGDSHLRMAVIDSAEPPDFTHSDEMSLRVSAISAASQRFFEAVDAWPLMLKRRVCPYRRMHVMDGEAGGETLFDCAEVAEPQLGHIIENRVIQLALVERLKQFDNIDWMCPASIQRMQHEGDVVRVTLGDGQVVTTRLLVGADGARSQVREQMGIALDEQSYEHCALVATVETALPQQDVTWQRFMPTGPQAFLPLLGHRASMVWYHDADEIARLQDLDEEAFLSEMQAAFPSQLGGLNRLIERGSFPLVRRHAKQYVKPRVALVGDAAHTIHPLAGQGVNLGLMDAACLAEVLLQDRGRRADPGRMLTLRRYERWRRGEVTAMMLLMQGFQDAFKPQPKPFQWVRSAMMNVTERNVLLKSTIVRYAMGTRGDLPLLAKGILPQA